MSFYFFFPAELHYIWVLVPLSEIEPVSLAMEAGSLNHLAAREAPPLIMSFNSHNNLTSYFFLLPFPPFYRRKS